MYQFSMTGFRGEDDGMESHTGLPTSEYLDDAMRRARREQLDESRFVDAGLRHWWIKEQGCLVEDSAPELPPRPAPIDRLLVTVGDLLVAVGIWLRRRSALGAEQPI